MGAKRATKAMMKKAKNAVQREAKQIGKVLVNQAKSEIRRSGKTLAFGALRTLTGMGDYKVNGLIKGGSTSSVPSFGSQHVRIRRREYIGTVTSSATAGAFSATKYQVNPGLFATFPWLASLAQSYESWKPHGIVYEFKTTSGASVGSTNTALGNVMIGAQYNSYATDPVDKIHMEGLANVLSIAPFEDGLCGLECRPKDRGSNTLLCRNASVSGMSLTGQDQIFDLCDVFVATNGLQAASVVLGDLWITYDIEFFNPIVPTVAPNMPNFYASGDTNIATSTPFGTSAANLPITNFGGTCATWASSTTLAITGLVVGQNYVFIYNVASGSRTTAAWTWTFTAMSANNGATQAPAAGATSITRETFTYNFTASGSSGTLTFAGAGANANCDNCRVRLLPTASSLYF